MRSYIWIFAPIFAMVTVIGSNGIGQSYSDGARVGFLEKVSRKGILSKSYEGRLVLRGISSHTVPINQTTSGTQLTNIWEFSTRDEKLGKKLLDLQGNHVKITYEQWLWKPLWQFTDYDAVAVTVPTPAKE